MMGFTPLPGYTNYSGISTESVLCIIVCRICVGLNYGYILFLMESEIASTSTQFTCIQNQN